MVVYRFLLSLTFTFTFLSTHASIVYGEYLAVEDSAKAIEHVRVIWIDNPATEAVVSWTTRQEGDRHSVYYDPGPRGGEPGFYRNEASSFKDGKFTMIDEDARWSDPGYYHHVHLQNLQPSTTYHFVIKSDDEVSREYHFTTAPEGDESFAILYGGDSRIGRESGRSTGLYPYDHTDRQDMFRRIASLIEENPEIIALAHSGDYCLEAEWRYTERWLNDFELTTTEDGRLLPIIPGRGNHDQQVGFEEMFSWPDLDNDYYFTMQLSAEVALVSLNTNISIAGDQRAWLSEQLSELRPANRWLFVQYHQPAYGTAKSVQDGARQRQHWVPLFEEYNVDLVGESDHHTLKRTLPIRNGESDLENGITYIGDGGLGVPQRTPNTDLWWLQEPGFATSAHHVQMIEFGKEEMRVRTFGVDSEVLDDFTVKPKNVPAQ